MLQGLVEHIRIDMFMTGPERPVNKIALRVGIDLVRGNLFFIDQSLDEGVIFGKDGEFSIAQEIGAAISNIDDEGLVVLNKGGGDGATETTRARLLFAIAEYSAVGLANGGFERVFNGVDGGRLGQLAGFLLLRGRLAAFAGIKPDG